MSSGEWRRPCGRASCTSYLTSCRKNRPSVTGAGASSIRTRRPGRPPAIIPAARNPARSGRRNRATASMTITGSAWTMCGNTTVPGIIIPAWVLRKSRNRCAPRSLATVRPGSWGSGQPAAGNTSSPPARGSICSRKKSRQRSRRAWARRIRPRHHAGDPGGLCHNRRVMVQGYHGTGKSTHIEQVAARLNWPCVRVNLDSHISRIDLSARTPSCCGRQAGHRVPRRHPALGAAAPVALVFDEYDAGRPDVMFVIQRVLEVGQADAARPEQGDPPASGVPPVRDRQHHRPGRHDGPLSRHPADQPGPDGPLVDRHHAELPAARRRAEIVLAKSPPTTPTRPQDIVRHGALAD
jgi:hypothetical protein